MSIINTITDDFEFWGWVKQSDSYSNNFSFEGANAVQAYFEELSEDIGENIEFDPIAWCCEFSEYDSFEQFQKDTGYTKDGVEHVGYPDIETVDDLREHTTVLIELDNGGIIVGEF
jgi:hypothetical protein